MSHLKALAGQVRDARPYNDFGRAVAEFCDAVTVQVSGQGATILEQNARIATLEAEVASLKAPKVDGE